MWHFKPCNFEHPKHGEQLSACIVHTLHFVSVSNPFSLHSIVAQTMVCILSSLGQMPEGVETGSLKKPAAALTAKTEPTHDGAAGAVLVTTCLLGSITSRNGAIANLTRAMPGHSEQFWLSVDQVWVEAQREGMVENAVPGDPRSRVHTVVSADRTRLTISCIPPDMDHQLALNKQRRRGEPGEPTPNDREHDSAHARHAVVTGAYAAEQLLRWQQLLRSTNANGPAAPPARRCRFVRRSA